MRQALAIAAALLAAPEVRADPYEVCAAAADSSPGYCDCAVATAQDSGIDGPALEQLLADDWAAVPKETAERFGLIVVECLRAAEPVAEPAAPVLSGGQGVTATGAVGLRAGRGGGRGAHLRHLHARCRGPAGAGGARIPRHRWRLRAGAAAVAR
ncbi:hypothetical protein [Mangrovicoccus ximenensis]|uniref:hypothetical protein n=1 Tax=Mangrovicoccus ximenensis TaxID=1911570 RepID=UPI0011AE7385|nr:hypothetical protein [Mangrovicoccus ximenensis]